MFKHYLEHIYMEDKGYLSSQFTIGFELEGWIPSRVNKTADDFWQFTADFFTERGYKMISKGMGHDPTIHPDDNRDESFELQSPVFPCTPHALQDIMHYLDQARRFGVETNKSCGFHVHIGFPDKMSVMEDRLWTLLQILFSKEDLLKKFTSFDQFIFTSNSWANPAHLATIKNRFLLMAQSVQQGQDLSECFLKFYSDVYHNNEKTSLLHLHPQGTLEWRGPRAFLDTGEYKYVKGFFTNLPKLITILSNLLNEQKLTVETKHGEFTLRKSDYTVMMPKEGRFAPRSVRKKFTNKDSRFKWADQKPAVLEQAFKDLLWLKKADVSGLLIEKEDDFYTITGSRINKVRNLSGCNFSLVRDISECTIGDANSKTTVHASSVYGCDIFKADIEDCELHDSVVHEGDIEHSKIYTTKMVNPNVTRCNIYGGAISGGEYTKAVLSNVTITGGNFRGCQLHSCKRQAGYFDESCVISGEVNFMDDDDEREKK